MPENLLPTITLTHDPLFLSSSSSSSSSFLPFFLSFVIGEFELKRVYAHGQTVDGILLILSTRALHLMNCKSKIKWKIVIYKPSSTRADKESDNINFFVFQIPHRNKCCELQFRWI